jgi:hypothetical protein
VHDRSIQSLLGESVLEKKSYEEWREVRNRRLVYVLLKTEPRVVAADFV